MGCPHLSKPLCFELQLELRILAHLCKDRGLVSILNSGQDVFVSIASQWLNIAKDDVTNDQRHKAKQICYGMIYGIGPKSLAEQLEVDEKTAFLFMEAFKNTYPGIKEFLLKVVEECQLKGYVETLFCRRRYLPKINSVNKGVKASAERQAVNTKVQGSAADLVKLAMVKIEKELHLLLERENGNGTANLDVGLILQIHDELLYEVTASMLPVVAHIVKTCMEGVAPDGIILPVNIKTGLSWGQLEKYIF